MENEKLKDKELNNQEMEQVSGGYFGVGSVSKNEMYCDFKNEPGPCPYSHKGRLGQCGNCKRNY